MKKRMMTIAALLAITTMTAGGFSTAVYAEAETEEAPAEMPELVSEEVDGGVVTTLTVGNPASTTST